MKKIVVICFAVVMVAMIFSSCTKETKVIIRDGVPVEIEDGDYVWTSCRPQPLVVDHSEFVSGSGDNAIYWYYFHISLDNSQANSTGAKSSDILFPHVGPSGTTIYENVYNDATYEVVRIADGIVYFRVKTANVVASGCPLKFNLAFSTSAGPVWFSANGSLTRNVGIDNGSDNVYFIIFNNGSVTKAF